MALPYLVKHIYSYGTEEVIRRGKKIFALKNIELAKFDPLIGSIHCRVKDDGYSTYYKVTIENFKSAATLSLRCGCPYNLSEVCRHKAAALFYIQDLLDKNLLDYKPASYKTTHTQLRTKTLDLKMIRMLCSKAIFEKAEQTLKSVRPHIIESENEKVVAEIDEKGKTKLSSDLDWINLKERMQKSGRSTLLQTNQKMLSRFFSPWEWENSSPIPMPVRPSLRLTMFLFVLSPPTV
ncbi:MAG: hypothetical protein RIT41_1198, partial [Bacteroidota bacterium]